MRLSEKTIELNYCAQLPNYLGPMFWFGLTQAQEARAGFDACTRLGGTLLVFQFKASNRILRSGDRQFRLPHEQLKNLKRVASDLSRRVFYAFPLLGTTAELPDPPDLVPQCALLDVAQLPDLDAPLRADGQPRATGVHLANVRRWAVTIYSKPTEVEVISIFDLLDQLPAASRETAEHSPGILRESFTGGAYGVVLLGNRYRRVA